MDNQELKYYKERNWLYKLQYAIDYFTISNNKDGFEYDVFDYAKDEIKKVEIRVKSLERQQRKK